MANPAQRQIEGRQQPGLPPAPPDLPLPKFRPPGISVPRALQHCLVIAGRGCVLLGGPQPVRMPTQHQLQRAAVQPAAVLAHAEARAGPQPVPAAAAALARRSTACPAVQPAHAEARAGPHNSCSCGSAAHVMHCVQRPGRGCLDASATYAPAHAWGAAWGDVAGTRKQACRREGGPAGRQSDCQHHSSQPHMACYTLKGSVGNVSTMARQACPNPSLMASARQWHASIRRIYTAIAKSSHAVSNYHSR